MTNTEELRERIRKSGLKLEYIAKQLGITRFTLTQKIENVSAFKVPEVQKICEILKIEDTDEKEYIFFADEVD